MTMIPIPVSLNNPFMSGGLVLMFFGGLLATLRKIPEKLWDWTKGRFSVTVHVTSDSPVFEWLTLWLDEHPYSKKARRLKAGIERRKMYDDGGMVEAIGWPRIIISPAHGDHFFRYKRRFVWLNRSKMESKGAQPLEKMFQQAEEYTITVIGKNQSVIRELLEDAKAVAKVKQQQEERVYISRKDWWEKLTGYVPRPLESVILPDGGSEEIMTDVRAFLTSKKWYEDHGIPYHRGYLFSGIPGSGKTSLIAAIGHELRMNLYSLNLGGKDMNDSDLISLMLGVPAGSIVLFEDIDGVLPNRVGKKKSKKEQTEEKNKVSLSCLLNCLDGLLANTGIVVFMTSNHPENLDPALIRPGRVDFKKDFGYAEPCQITRLFKRFYDNLDADTLARAVKAAGKKSTMAELQTVLLTNKNDAEAAIASLSS